MKKFTTDAFLPLWLFVGPSLLWQLTTGGFNLLGPINASFLTLALVGTSTAFSKKPALRLTSGISGVLLGILLFYTAWALGALSSEWIPRFSFQFWAFTISGWPGASIAVCQSVFLIALAAIVAWNAADDFDNKRGPNKAPEPKAPSDGGSP